MHPKHTAMLQHLCCKDACLYRPHATLFAIVTAPRGKDLNMTLPCCVCILCLVCLTEFPCNARLATLEKAYQYDGDATCAADGMCQVKCPVKINTGELIKSLREEELQTHTRATGLAKVCSHDNGCNLMLLSQDRQGHSGPRIWST